jgi:hypothetical protein
MRLGATIRSIAYSLNELSVGVRQKASLLFGTRAEGDEAD